MSYQLVNFRGSPSCVKKVDGDLITLIPLNSPNNTDYQQYLAWLEAGNTPEPADE
jgi:hypothetical protein